MARTADERIVRKGEWGTVEYAVRANGSCPARHDLDKIKKKDKQNYIRLDVLFIHVAKIGRGSLSKGKFGHLKGEIFEFKRHPYRVGCFFRKNRCLLTHVFPKKKSQAYVSEQIKKAKEIMRAHLEFEKGDMGTERRT